MATIRARNGAYQIRVSLGYDLNGKQITKTMTWKPPASMTAKQIDKELQRQAALFEDRAKSGLILDGNTRFADYAQRWLSGNEVNLAPSTIQRYVRNIALSNKAIGHIKLSQLQAQHLQEFYKQLAQPGMNKRTGGVLSANTIGSVHRMIKAMLQEAYKQGYVLRNVAALVTPPKVKPKEVAYLDESDISNLYAALSTESVKWRTALLLLLYVGMRRGELIGLEWSDVDFNNKVIHIHRNTQEVYGKRYEYTDESGKLHKGTVVDRETKTAGSNRYLSIDQSVIDLLFDYREWWIGQKLINGSRWIETDKLFIRENGGVMSPSSVTKYITAFCKKHNLPHFSPHSLRHTNISVMIAEGVDIKTTSARAGHSSPTITANVYTHQIQSANARAAEKIENVFKKIVGS